MQSNLPLPRAADHPTGINLVVSQVLGQVCLDALSMQPCTVQLTAVTAWSW